MAHRGCVDHKWSDVGNFDAKDVLLTHCFKMYMPGASSNNSC